MKKLALFLLSSLLISQAALAVVVAGRVQLVGPTDGGLQPDFYRLNQYHTADSSPSDFLTFSVAGLQTFTVTDVSLGIGFRVFVLSAGDQFTAQYVNTHPFLATNNMPAGMGNTFNVPIAGSTYLGFHVPDPNGTLGVEGERFSWVRITNSGTLQVAAEATSIGAGGIIVGTTTEVPEPATGMLMAGVAVLLVLCRRR